MYNIIAWLCVCIYMYTYMYMKLDVYSMYTTIYTHDRCYASNQVNFSSSTPFAVRKLRKQLGWAEEMFAMIAGHGVVRRSFLQLASSTKPVTFLAEKSPARDLSTKLCSTELETIESWLEMGAFREYEWDMNFTRRTNGTVWTGEAQLWTLHAPWQS